MVIEEKGTDSVGLSAEVVGVAQEVRLVLAVTSTGHSELHTTMSTADTLAVLDAFMTDIRRNGARRCVVTHL